MEEEGAKVIYSGKKVRVQEQAKISGSNTMPHGGG
jgi:hypothetical protein